MVFKRFASTDVADLAALLNRLGDDLDDTITKVLGARQAAQADPTGVLARYADTAQKAWDGLSALTQRVTNAENGVKALGAGAPTTAGIVFKSGFSDNGPIGAWSGLSYVKAGSVVFVNGAVKKSSNLVAGEVMFTMPAGLRPAAYWQFPRGNIRPSGEVESPEGGNPVTALSFFYPIA